METKIFKQVYPDAIEHIATNDPTPCYDEIPLLVTLIQTGRVISLTADLINSLTQVRLKLFEVDEGQNIDLLEAFCGSCPSDLLFLFSK